MKNSVSKYLYSFFNEYLTCQKNVSVHTIKSYKKTFELFFRCLQNMENINITKMGLESFNNNNVSNFLNYLENERHNLISTRNQRFAAICSFIKFVYPNEADKILQFQQVLNIPMKKLVDVPKEYLSVEDMKLLLIQPNSKTKKGRRDLTLLATLYDTGARVSELINLTVADLRIDNDNSTIRLMGKGKKVRVIPIVGNTATLLKNYLSENNLIQKLNNYVFTNASGNKLTEPGITYILEKYRQQAKENNNLFPNHISPHVMRHSKAMHLLEAGVNYIYIRDFLGHADIKTTETYAKISVELKRRVLNEVHENNAPEAESIWQKDQNLLEYLMSL